MKLLTGKICKFVTFLIVFATLLSACSPAVLPSGQVKGVLVKDGEPFSGKQVFLVKLNEGEDNQGTWQLNTSWQAKSDDSGSFLFEEILAGTYRFVVFTSDLGGFEYVLKDGDIFVFDLPEENGIDLGKVDASDTQPVQ
jgi:hypothetical protein